MTESALLGRIIELMGQMRAAGADLVWHHCRNSTSCEGVPGLPDLIILGPGGVVFAEVKTEAGDTTPGQDLWIWLLSRHGNKIGQLWRPSDLVSGAIERELRRVARA